MNNKDTEAKKDKNKNKDIIQNNIIIILLLIIIIILLLSRCSAIDKCHDSPQIKNNTESNVSKNDNDYDNSNIDLIPIDKNATEDSNNIASSEAEKTGDNYNKFVGYRYTKRKRHL